VYEDLDSDEESMDGNPNGPLFVKRVKRFCERYECDKVCSYLYIIVTYCCPVMLLHRMMFYIFLIDFPQCLLQLFNYKPQKLSRGPGFARVGGLRPVCRREVNHGYCKKIAKFAVKKYNEEQVLSEIAP